jgi:hypothetical protein
MTTSKIEQYRSEADRYRQLAAVQTCLEAREYYEALCRDYVKLADAELRRGRAE